MATQSIGAFLKQIRAVPFERLSVLGDDVIVLATGTETEGRFFICIIITPPGKHRGAPLHRHERETQYMRVLEGELCWQVGECCGVARVGESIFTPIGVAHRFWNASSSRVVALMIVTPAGLEFSFRRLHAPGATSTDGLDPMLLTSIDPNAILRELETYHAHR